MILTMTKMYDYWGGRYSILAYHSERWWVMEREWQFNQRNVSCVPRDEYTLEEHSSKKYPHTWALIGDAVGHFANENKPRYACVMHTAVYPSDLEGCLTVCHSIGAAGAAIGAREAWDSVTKLFDSASEPIKILMSE